MTQEITVERSYTITMDHEAVVMLHDALREVISYIGGHMVEGQETWARLDKHQRILLLRTQLYNAMGRED